MQGNIQTKTVNKIDNIQAFTGKFSLGSIWSSPGTFKESY